MQEGETVKARPGPNEPSSVPEQARQEGEIRARWAWVEERVWTTPMLATLERGIKGGKWFALIDKVSAEQTLQRAWAGVKSNGGSAGVDGETVRGFGENCHKRLLV